MSDTTFCSTCHTVLAQEFTDGRCPACLVASAFGAGDAEGLGQIGGYELLEEIRRGGMGVVYRARQQEPQREVALKAILGGWLSAPEVRERFRQEARAMASLEHPAILPVYQFGEEDGVPFFTMKLAHGGTLGERRASYAGHWRKIAELMIAVAGAVEFAHSRGVLHRDLKPGNILFDEEGRPYVSDFGLAKLADAAGDLTLSADLLGTPHYLAPELAGQTAPASTASDVWSLGVVLFELLAQERPFTAAGIPALLREIVEHPPATLPAGVPRDLGVIARKALAKEPGRRFAGARELSEDLQRWLNSEPIQARPASGWEKLRLWGRRNPGLGTAAALVAGVVLGSGYLLWKSNRQLRHSLARSFVEQAALARMQPHAGTRADALRLLREAVDLEPDPTVGQVAAWRSEAAGALALPEVAETRRIPVFVEHNSGQESFSADFRRYAAALAGGGFGVFATEDGGAVQTFTAPAGQEEEWRNFSAGAFLLSPDGTQVAAGFFYPDRGQALTRLYEVASGRLLKEFSWTGKALLWPAWGFRGGSGFLMGEPDGWLMEREAAGDPPHLIFPEPLPYSPDPSRVALSQNGQSLAVTTVEPFGLAVWDVAAGGGLLQQRWHLPLLSEPRSLAWSADGQWLALGEGQPATAPDETAGARPTCEILLVDAGRGILSGHLPGPPVPVVAVAFAGDSVLSIAGDERLIWQSRSGDFRLTLPAQERLFQVSPEGTRVAYAPQKGTVAIADLIAPTGGKLWTGSGGARFGSCLAATADGATLAISTHESLQLWDGATRTLRQNIPWPASFEISWPWLAVAPGGSTVVVAPGSQPGRLNPLQQFHLDAGGRAGPPQQMPPGSPMDTIHGFSPDGRGWVVSGKAAGARTGDALDFELWPEGDPARRRPLIQNVLAAGMHFCTPDGRYGITASQHQPDAHVWDLTTGKEVRSLGYPVPVTCYFAPDRRTVVVVSPEESALWDTATWQKRSAWTTPPGGEGFTPGFSPDGKFISQFDRDGHVQFHTADGQPFLTLTLPSTIPPIQSVWLGPHRFVVMGRTGELFEWDLSLLAGAVRAAGLPW